MGSYQQPAIAQEQNMTEGGGGILEGRNATDATGAAGGNQSEIRTNLEQARMALQNNDTQGAMMYLDMALSALGGGAGAATGRQRPGRHLTRKAYPLGRSARGRPGLPQ